MSVLELARPAADIEQKIRTIDTRLDSLRRRRTQAEAELNRLVREENKLIRNFANSEGREKQDIRARLSGLATDRTSQELEMQGLSVAIAEAEQERNELLPEYEREWKLRSAQERQRRLAELRRAHEANLAKVREADRMLQEARAAADRSFFDWTTFKDQQLIEEQLAAQEAHKAEWQKKSGPFSPQNRR